MIIFIGFCFVKPKPKLVSKVRNPNFLPAMRIHPHQYAVCRGWRTVGKYILLTELVILGVFIIMKKMYFKKSWVWMYTYSLFLIFSKIAGSFCVTLIISGNFNWAVKYNFQKNCILKSRSILSNINAGIKTNS